MNKEIINSDKSVVSVPKSEVSVAENVVSVPENVLSVPSSQSKPRSENSQLDYSQLDNSQLASIYPKLKKLKVRLDMIDDDDDDDDNDDDDRVQDDEKEEAISANVIVPEPTFADSRKSDDKTVSKESTIEECSKQPSELSAQSDSESPSGDVAENNALNVQLLDTDTNTTRRLPRKMTLIEKFEAVSRVSRGETKAAVARDLDISESTLRGWCKAENKIMCEVRMEYLKQLRELDAPSDTEASPAANVAEDNALNVQLQMPSAANTKRKFSRKITAIEKLEAVSRVLCGEKKAAVARDIDVPESTLRGWCKSPQNIMKQAQEETKLQQLAHMYASIENTTSSSATDSPRSVDQRADNDNAQCARDAFNESLNAESPIKRRRVAHEARSTASTAMHNPEPDISNLNPERTVLKIITEMSKKFLYTGNKIMDENIYWQNVMYGAIYVNTVFSALRSDLLQKQNNANNDKNEQPLSLIVPKRSMESQNSLSLPANNNENEAIDERNNDPVPSTSSGNLGKVILKRAFNQFSINPEKIHEDIQMLKEFVNVQDNTNQHSNEEEEKETLYVSNSESEINAENVDRKTLENEETNSEEQEQK